ncbi:glycosyltransferase family 4 protein [bacterium]|nr:glycosyltransferase family 4 protein [bacterium]
MCARIGIDCRKILDYGIGTITARLIENLAALDDASEYFTFGDPAVIPGLGDNFATVREHSGEYSLKGLLSLPLKAKRLRLDLLHWLHYPSSPLKPCRFVISIHDINHLVYPQFMRSRRSGLIYAKAMLRLASKVADRIITASESSKKEIVERLKIAPERVSVVSNGVAPIFRPQNKEQALDCLARDYALEQPYILHVGSLRQHKNIDRLIDAFAIIKKREPLEHCLVIAGDHSEQGALLRQKACDMGLERAIRFLGAIEHGKLPTLYSGADLFVFPSLYEGFGLPPVEAMASGVPVCASNIPVLVEVIGRAGEFFDPESPQEMADAIISVLTDSEKRESLRIEGLARAKSFSWRETARKTLGIYHEVLGK